MESTPRAILNDQLLQRSELLLDRQDNNGLKQVTTVYNRFGKHLTQISASRYGQPAIFNLQDVPSPSGRETPSPSSGSGSTMGIYLSEDVFSGYNNTL